MKTITFIKKENKYKHFDTSLKAAEEDEMISTKAKISKQQLNAKAKTVAEI